ncbi:sigma-70 family RNA polymerase sigma factor [bacterium]|nr:sigma-70 family RNA polymerase sigma factor [candidate division CSSED10-310 bacterium]
MIQPEEKLKLTLEQEKEKMFRIAWKMCGNQDEAEEVLQETALKALKNWNQFRGESLVSTWLYRIASNTCLSRKRKRMVHTVDPIILEEIAHDTEPDMMAGDADWSRDPLAQTLNDELRHALDAAIYKLPETYRLVFVMRDIEGMSGEETAQSLDISVTNVKVRLHRARLFLRNELDAYIKEERGVTS